MGGVDRGASTGPTPASVAAYDALYAEYRTLHDYFGRGANDVMQRLRARSAGEARGMSGRRTSTRRIRRLRDEVAALHAELTRYELVVWTAGNVSAPGARRATCW